MGPDEYILRSAKLWRETEKRMIGSQGKEKDAATSEHLKAKRKLREAVDSAENAKGKR